jgi:hypothetical protein
MTLGEAGHTEATPRTCPRCGTSAVQVFYGPCDACRADLLAKYRVEGRDVAVSAEERVHRTPNFVATKD